MWFKLIAGVAKIGNKTYKKGDSVESETDLTVQFVNSFERIPPPAPAEEVEGAPGKAKVKSKAAPAKKEETPEKNFGDDVTTKYPKAPDADVLIFQNDQGFTVVDKDDPTTALNERPLPERDVNKFIAKYLKP